MDQRYCHRLRQRLAYVALEASGRGQWMGKLRRCFKAFGWHDYSCATLAEVSGATQEDAEECGVPVCGERLGGRPWQQTQAVLNSVCANGFII